MVSHLLGQYEVGQGLVQRDSGLHWVWTFRVRSRLPPCTTYSTNPLPVQERDWLSSRFQGSQSVQDYLLVPPIRQIRFQCKKEIDFLRDSRVPRRHNVVSVHWSSISTSPLDYIRHFLSGLIGDVDAKYPLSGPRNIIIKLTKNEA